MQEKKWTAEYCRWLASEKSFCAWKNTSKQCDDEGMGKREKNERVNKQFLKCKQRNVIFPCFFSRHFTLSRLFVGLIGAINCFSALTFDSTGSTAVNFHIDYCKSENPADRSNRISMPTNKMITPGYK